MITEIVNQRILKAEDGMYLTNGETYGKTVVLPADAEYSAWHEISEAEYLAIREKEEAQE